MSILLPIDFNPINENSSVANKVIAEERRLQEARASGVPWKKWGPYLAERQWGTVREDYSENGNAWDYFSHDHNEFWNPTSSTR
jgi:hypothetical protein